MTVEKIEKYKGETYMVVIDRVKKVFLHRDIINRFGLAEGSEITNEQLTQVLMASELRRASRRAMYLINERDYSYIQLFEKLSANYSEEPLKAGIVFSTKLSGKILTDFMNALKSLLTENILNILKIRRILKQ